MKGVLAEAAITMDRQKARVKVAEYLKSVRTRHDAEDQAILRGYKALAKGPTVIDLELAWAAGGYRHGR